MEFGSKTKFFDWTQVPAPAIESMLSVIGCRRSCFIGISFIRISLYESPEWGGAEFSPRSSFCCSQDHRAFLRKACGCCLELHSTHNASALALTAWAGLRPSCSLTGPSTGRRPLHAASYEQMKLDEAQRKRKKKVRFNFITWDLFLFCRELWMGFAGNTMYHCQFLDCDIARYYHCGRLGKQHTGSVCIISYKCLWVYGFLKRRKSDWNTAIFLILEMCIECSVCMCITFAG